MNPRTRLLVSEFWEFLAFFVNSIVFLLIGDQIHYSRLVENFSLIAGDNWGGIGNASSCYLWTQCFEQLVIKSQIGWREQTILWWGGLRGSVSIALAVSVPIILPGREEIIDMVFGVVLFTLLVQGLTTQWFLERLGLIGDQPVRQQYSEAIARRVALNRVLNYYWKLAKN
jgi:CPA1 family monovalent cation:H+ antiporter